MAQINRYCPTCDKTFQSYEPSLTRDASVTQECTKHLLAKRRFYEVTDVNGNVMQKATSDDGGATFRDPFGNPIVFGK